MWISWSSIIIRWWIIWISRSWVFRSWICWSWTSGDWLIISWCSWSCWFSISRCSSNFLCFSLCLLILFILTLFSWGISCWCRSGWSWSFILWLRSWIIFFTIKLRSIIIMVCWIIIISMVYRSRSWWWCRVTWSMFSS